MKTCVIGSAALLILSIEALSLAILGLWGFYGLGKLVLAMAEHNIY